MTLADILRHKGSSVVTVDGRTSIHQAVRTLVDETMDDIAGFFGSLGFEPSTLRPFAMTL